MKELEDFGKKTFSLGKYCKQKQLRKREEPRQKRPCKQDSPTPKVIYVGVEPTDSTRLIVKPTPTPKIIYV